MIFVRCLFIVSLECSRSGVLGFCVRISVGCCIEMSSVSDCMLFAVEHSVRITV